METSFFRWWFNIDATGLCWNKIWLMLGVRESRYLSAFVWFDMGSNHPCMRMFALLQVIFTPDGDTWLLMRRCYSIQELWAISVAWSTSEGRGAIATVFSATVKSLYYFSPVATMFLLQCFPAAVSSLRYFSTVAAVFCCNATAERCSRNAKHCSYNIFCIYYKESGSIFTQAR